MWHWGPLVSFQVPHLPSTGLTLLGHLSHLDFSESSLTVSSTSVCCPCVLCKLKGMRERLNQARDLGDHFTGATESSGTCGQVVALLGQSCWPHFRRPSSQCQERRAPAQEPRGVSHCLGRGHVLRGLPHPFLLGRCPWASSSFLTSTHG